MPGQVNAYHQHLENCTQCRENPVSGCDEGARSVRQAVQDGSPNQFDHELDKIRNGEPEDQ